MPRTLYGRKRKLTKELNELRRKNYELVVRQKALEEKINSLTEEEREKFMESLNPELRKKYIEFLSPELREQFRAQYNIESQ